MLFIYPFDHGLETHFKTFLKRNFSTRNRVLNSGENYFTLICMDFYLNCSFYLMHFTTNLEYLRDSEPEDRTPIWRNVFTEKCISALILLCLRKITQTFFEPKFYYNMKTLS